MVVINKLANGIMFDASSLPGAGDKFASKKFVPSNFSNVDTVMLYNDRVVANSAYGESYSLNLNGSEGAYPVSTIDGTPVNTLEELFNLFIGIL